jgi:CIC family chloride channel protein
LILDTIFLGVVGALSAQLFMVLLRLMQWLFLVKLAHYQPPGLPQEGGVLLEVIGSYGLWLVPLAVTLGGLLSGLLVYTFAPEAEGHGTDTGVKAFHQGGGFIRARVPPLKLLASAITIGSGGAAGREGPTALISAGVGSVYATLRGRPEEERRLLMLIGMASGLAAIFRSPVGTALFAIEVLYSEMEFESSALLYTLLGSVVAYAVNGLFVGWSPLFRVPASLPVPGFLDYAWYLLLGIIAGLVATLLPLVFYSLRDGFHAIPIPPHVKPALGGLGVGLMALALPQVLGGGYGWIQEVMDGRLTGTLLLILVFAKMAAFSLTVSSGGSGGVFAPSLCVGAMLGGFFAHMFHLPAAPFVLVGMAAVFAGAARVPIASMLMVTEMTGGYHFLVPAALAVMVSYLVQVTLSKPLKYKSLYEAQVSGRADSPAHHAEHLDAALRLLTERRISVPPMLNPVNLRALLRAGVPVGLAEGKQLVLATVDGEVPLAGRTILETIQKSDEEPLEVLALFRDGELRVPGPEAKLVSGDQLLLVTSPGGWERFTKELRLRSREKVDDGSTPGEGTSALEG